MLITPPELRLQHFTGTQCQFQWTLRLEGILSYLMLYTSGPVSLKERLLYTLNKLFVKQVKSFYLLLDPNPFIFLCLLHNTKYIKFTSICRASARPPASQSTAPHFPSSMDGVRNRKGSKQPRPSKLDNRTPLAKSDKAQFDM